MDYSTLTDEELSKLLHEKVMGECWHEWNGDVLACDCSKCGKEMRGWIGNSPSYTTNWSDYGRLLEAVRDHVDFPEFIYWCGDMTPVKVQDTVELLLTPRKGCEAIAEFFCKGDHNANPQS